MAEETEVTPLHTAIDEDDVFGPLLKKRSLSKAELAAAEATDPTEAELQVARRLEALMVLLSADADSLTTGAALLSVLSPDVGNAETVRDALVALVNRVPRNVRDKDLTSPPGGESDGDRYLIFGVGADGWTGKQGSIATYNEKLGDYRFLDPVDGMEVYVADEDEVYLRQNGAWVLRSTAGGTAIVDGDFAGAYTALLARSGAATYESVRVNLAGGADPTVNDDDTAGYGLMSLWFTATAIFMCVDDTTGAAVWVRIDLPSGTTDFIGGGQFRATYDFAVHGGAQGEIPFGPTFPDKSNVKIATLDVITALNSGGAATAGLGVATDGADELVADTAFGGAPWSTTGLKDTIPDGAAANMTTQTTAARKLALTVANADLTAGKFVVTGSYHVSE